MISKIKKNFEINKKIILLILGAVLIIPPLIFGTAGSESDSEKKERPSAEDTPNRTYIIGKHMIYVDSLTEDLKEIAQNSDQTNKKMYFKEAEEGKESGENDNIGVWYEVSYLKDNINKGHFVENKDIDSLEIYYYTDETGKTYDFKNNKYVDIFNVEDVYNVKNMKELEKLKLKYEELEHQAGDDVSTDKESLKNILELKFEDNDKKTYDEKLDKLNKYYEHLVEKEASDDKKKKIVEIRAAVNSQRNIFIIDKVIEKINKENNKDNISSNLKEMYDEAVRNLTSSKLSLESKTNILSDEMKSNSDSNDKGNSSKSQNSDRLIDKKQKEAVKELIDNIMNDRYTEADKILKRIIILDSLKSSDVSGGEEIDEILSELEKEARANYESLVNQGESEDYKTKKSSESSSAELKSLEEFYEQDLNRKAQDFIDVSDMQIKKIEGIDNKREKIKAIISSLSEIKANLVAESKTIGSSGNSMDRLFNPNQDQFKNIAIKSLEKTIGHFEDEQKKVDDELNKDNDIAKKEKEIKALKEEYKKALDKNDIAKAKEIENKIEELQKSISSDKNKANNNVKNIDKELSKIKERMASKNLSKDTLSNLEKRKRELESLKKSEQRKISSKTSRSQDIADAARKAAREALSKASMKNSDVKNISDSVSKIKDVGKTDPKTASSALDEINKDIESKIASDQTAPSSLLGVAEDVDKAMEELKSDSEKQVSEELKEEVLDEKISSFSENNELDDKTNELLALGALNELLDQYGEVDDNMSVDDLSQDQKIIKLKIDKILSSLLGDQGTIEINNSENKCAVIEKRYYNSEIYASAETIANLLGMKYVWNSNLVKGWISGSGKNYCFIQGKDVVIEPKKHAKMMNKSVFDFDKQNTESNLWLPKSFLLDEFKMVVEGIKTTSKSVLYDEKTYEKVQDMLKTLAE